MIVLLSPSATRVDFVRELQRRGAHLSATLISVNSDLDNTTLPLPTAIDAVFALEEATIVCCGAALGYYEGEGQKTGSFCIVAESANLCPNAYKILFLIPILGFEVPKRVNP